jgi:hypothetical protein
MMTCKICSHADRAAIDKALVDGGSLRSIAKQFKVHSSSVNRHKSHIPKTLALAKQAETVAGAGTLLSRVEKLAARCESMIDKAENAENWRAAPAAARELRGCLELLAKLNGELQPGGVRVAINIGNVGGLIRSLVQVNIRDISDEDLELISGWLSSIAPLPGHMSDAEIDAELRKIAREAMNTSQLESTIQAEEIR